MRTTWIFWACFILSPLAFTAITGVTLKDTAIVKRQAVKGNPGCYKEKAANEGTITSPNFPKNYPDSLDCHTEITLYYNEIISFKFNTLEVEYEENCTADYVEIFDGLHENAPSLGRYCSDPGKFLQSTSNTMRIHFHSDQVINNKGFSANYTVHKIEETVDCGEKLLTKSSGEVQSPDFLNRVYPNNADCYTQITIPEGKTINFRFGLVNIEYDEQCSLDYVEVFDGPTNDSKSLGKFCSKPAKTLRSSGNSLLIHFHSDEDVNYAGFVAKYSDEEIEIDDRPLEHFLAFPYDATVPKDSVHEMKCIPRDPTLEWTWYKDGQPLQGSNPLPNLKLEDDILTIENMNTIHVGEYSCEIQLDGKPFAAKANIKITKRKNCDFDIKRFDGVTTKEGGLTKLECVTTSQFLRVSWKKNGQPVTNGTGAYFLFDSGHLLIIQGIKHEDQGNYTCVAKDVVADCEKRETVEVVVLRRAEVCGIPKVGRSISTKPTVAGGKIVGGNTAQKGAFPWQALIWDTTKNATICGGSLLNKKWVLTAAHCIKLSSTPFSQLNIFLGKHDAGKRERGEQRRTISRAEVHPEYSSSTHDNDVALLELNSKVKYTDYIIPICLGEPNVIEESVFKKNSYKGTVTGWGRIIEGGAQARFLKEVRLPMVEQGECWKSTRLTVTKNMFCAGYAEETVGDARDACEGDSGGPFAVEFRKRWYVAGVVSWSEGIGACARKGKYGFYAKVNNYYNWISGLVGANEI